LISKIFYDKKSLLIFVIPFGKLIFNDELLIQPFTEPGKFFNMVKGAWNWKERVI